MGDFKALLHTTWVQYKRWREVPLFCPALDNYIHFTLKGWNHIAETKKDKRTLVDARVDSRL
jgi:hypothetical protein